MGLIKGILKVGASAILTVTGTASAVLNGMCETAGVDIGSEIFGAIKNASFNGIKSMWEIENSAQEEYTTKGEARRAEFAEEVNRMKVMAIRKKDLAQKCDNNDLRDRLMDEYEELWQQACEMIYEPQDDDGEPIGE